MSPSLVAPLPTVKVGGRSYSVRFSQGAFYLLGTWGIDISRAVQVHNEMIASGRGREYEGKLAAASLGNLDSDGRWRSLGLTPLEVMDSLLDGEWGELSAASWGEYKKKLGLVLMTEAPPTIDLSTKSDGSSTGPSEQPGVLAA
jgi:hypothetical protein